MRISKPCCFPDYSKSQDKAGNDSTNFEQECSKDWRGGGRDRSGNTRDGDRRGNNLADQSTAQGSAPAQVPETVNNNAFMQKAFNAANAQIYGTMSSTTVIEFSNDSGLINHTSSSQQFNYSSPTEQIDYSAHQQSLNLFGDSGRQGYTSSRQRLDYVSGDRQISWQQFNETHHYCGTEVIDMPEMPTGDVRNFTGEGNNSNNPDWGSTDIPFTRIAPQDPSRNPDVNDLPSAREISNVVFADDGMDSLDPDGASDLLWQWGQFIDHDMTLTPESSGVHADIEVPTGDRAFDPFGTGKETISFERSEGSLDENGLNQQSNALTAFLDGSQVYGSDLETADSLRSFDGGKLKTSADNALPVDPETGEFLAGDVRVNEQPGLTSMHTLFMREHNRLAEQYATENPSWSDEQIYQAARAKNTAFMQSITYNEFLPELLGEDALADYEGYDPTANPSISNEFATAAFRFGHSMVSPTINRVGPDGELVEGGELSLRDAFNNPDLIKNEGIDAFIRGQATNVAQKLDNEVIDVLRNQLFGAPGSGAGGLDLTALNIQRGRDHELASYNDTREAMGQHRIESWDDPIFRDGLGEKLSQVYDSPDDIDLWVGGLAENDVAGSKMGQLFTAINAQQFQNLRDGDRFFYGNVYSGYELAEINNTSLSDIIRRNTDVDDIQDNAFRVTQSPYA